LRIYPVELSYVGGVYAPVGCCDPFCSQWSRPRSRTWHVKHDAVISLCQLLFARGRYKAEYFLCIITGLPTIYSYFLP